MRVTNLATRLLLLGTFLVTTLATKADVHYLISLKGQEFEMGNLLEWSTLKEINSSFFYIEKSVNGIDFQQIGKVDAEGKVEESTDYHFLDVGVSDTKVFYRLKEIEKDGSYSYSHTVMVRKNRSNNYSILNLNTTEINDLLRITLQCKNAGAIKVAVLNESGETLHAFEKVVSNGTEEIPVNMIDYQEGIYRIALTMGTEREILVLKKVTAPVEGFAAKDE